MRSEKFKLISKDSCGQVGIGTLIIFLAMILVASVAAGVLIHTSGDLQQKAQSTGTQATEEISSNLQIIGIEGIRANNGDSNMSDSIDLLRIKTGLNVGSTEVDLSSLVITISDGQVTNDLVYGSNTILYGSEMDGFTGDISNGDLTELLNNTHGVAGPNIASFFTVERMRDEDNSLAASTPVLNSGDIAIIYIGTASSDAVGYTYLGDFNATQAGVSLKDSGLALNSRTAVDIQMTPEKGSQTITTFKVPTLNVKEKYMIR
ncbi:MAG: archaellin/type IV pilin N-terminal domain-containing protein [Halobacteriota archaeon]